MNLWDTEAGDRWLCGICQKELALTISDENWRLVFKKTDPEIQCSECGQNEVEIEE